MNNYKYLFGPVPSRRLGLSLGIDLVPYKTCNLNCVYCECGNTTNLTNIRQEYVNVEEIIKELDGYLSKVPELDYITFSGAGEPLLNIGIGKIVKFLKKEFPFYRLALLTNGILLSDESIFNEIKDIDVIIPSLDAGSEEVFHRINRPVKAISFKSYIEGLIKFSKFIKKYNKELWVEVFLLKGINDSSSELAALKSILDKVLPDKIQLNTVDRPPAENVQGVGYQEMLKISSIFKGNVEIVKNFRNIFEVHENSLELILNCLKRRPLTVEDIVNITNLHINEVNKLLDVLEKEGKLDSVKGERGVFYKLK